jgi:hypothetical protein
MTGLSRSACLTGLAAALVLSTSGCDPYTYFNVDVSLGSNVTDQNRFDIVSCLVFVVDDSTGKEIEHTNLDKVEGPSACKDLVHNPTDPDIGVMDYSTTRSSGTLTFFVSMVDTAKSPIAQGSASAGVSPGKVLSVDLVCNACGTSCKNIADFQR